MVGQEELGEFANAVNRTMLELKRMTKSQKDDLNGEFSSGFNARMSRLYYCLHIVDELRYSVDTIYSVCEKKCLILAGNDKVYEMEWWASFPNIKLVCTLPFFKCDVKKVFQTMVETYK